jgi:hypothetical protein
VTDTGRESTVPHCEALAELEQALSQQLALAERGDFQAMGDPQEALAPLLERANALPAPLPENCRERLARIREMHRRLVLTLNDSRRAMGEKLEQMRRGQKSLRAYRNGGM